LNFDEAYRLIIGIRIIIFVFSRYFSDRVSPAVHDVSKKKTGFSTWKEEFWHKAFYEKEARLKSAQIWDVREFWKGKFSRK
jgi:hypothetical protein